MVTSLSCSLPPRCHVVFSYASSTMHICQTTTSTSKLLARSERNTAQINITLVMWLLLCNLIDPTFSSYGTVRTLPLTDEIQAYLVHVNHAVTADVRLAIGECLTGMGSIRAFLWEKEGLDLIHRPVLVAPTASRQRWRSDGGREPISIECDAESAKTLSATVPIDMP